MGITTLLITLATSFASLGTLTPAQTIVSDYLQYSQTVSMVKAELELFEKENICKGEFEQEMRYWFNDSKVYCPEVKNYFMQQYKSVGNLEMKLSGMCQEHFNTSNLGYCVHMAANSLVTTK